MSPRPRILVIGGTGAQGGSVARHLLAEGRCRVRCLTRRLDSVAARSLADAGAEVVQGDMADRDSLDAALAGCEAVFGVTNYFEHFEAEYELGAQLLDAVVDSTAEHLVLSTLPSASKLSSGKLSVPHFEHKARLEALVRGKEIFATLPIPGAAALADMFELYRSHVGAKPEDLAASRRLYPGIRDFATWAHAHRDDLRAAMDA